MGKTILLILIGLSTLFTSILIIIEYDEGGTPWLVLSFLVGTFFAIIRKIDRS